jgi:diguanylate cyclase (GGDEF)-like protein
VVTHNPSSRGMPVLIGVSRAVQALRMEIAFAARTQANVLLVGETGTETETVARLIHAQSERGDRPFLVAQCKGVAPALLTSHLFGHTRGSFTGAFRDKAGLVERAKDGTLFLNNINELSLHTQDAVLEFLQSEGTLRSGADAAATPNAARLITAARRPLGPLVAEHRFLQALAHRLTVVQIHVPPLRDRDTDILLLWEHYVAHAAQHRGVPVPALAPDAAQRLLAYAWPGNVEELEKLAEHVVATHRSDAVTVDDLSLDIQAAEPRTSLALSSPPISPDPNPQINIDDKAHRHDVTEPVPTLPTRAALHAWIRDTLSLPTHTERLLINAIDEVLLYYERVWRSSKDEALRAVATGFGQRFERMREELSAREATSRNVARYFERVVADLTERTHRDAKTQLLHFRRFMEHVEIGLSMAREEGWCALGVADITAFKALNDTLGHAAGDRVLERIADLLRSEVRCSDLVGYQPDAERPPALHARFGGDEFCFFLSNLDDAEVACTVGERFWYAVAEYDWATEDRRFTTHKVTVDIGVTCLQLGPFRDRQLNARTIAEDLFARADRRLYAVKGGFASHISCEAVRVDEEGLIEIGPIFSKGRDAGRDTA